MASVTHDVAHEAAAVERPETRKSGPSRPLDHSGRAPRAESRIPV
jgi:hypothetical protein